MWRSHNLLNEWVGRTLRARYQQSVLGWLWAVAQPATQALILAVIFTRIVPVETGSTPYVLFAFVATAPWAFLGASLTDMTGALVDNMTLVNKVYFDREVLPVAAMLARLVDLALTLAFVFPLAAYFGVPVFSWALLALPIVILVQMLLIAGVGLAAAALNVFVRDVRSIMALALQLWFYASPVLYPLDQVPPALAPYISLNPMTGIIEAYRAVLLKGTWPDGSLIPATAVAVGACMSGYYLFKRLESRFADVV